MGTRVDRNTVVRTQEKKKWKKALENADVECDTGFVLDTTTFLAEILGDRACPTEGWNCFHESIG